MDMDQSPAMLLFLDPPDHTRLRRLVTHAFTPADGRAAAPARRRDLVDGLLADVDPAGFDLIESVAYPLPVIVICELLGVPVEDRTCSSPWRHDVSRLLDGDIDDAAFSAGVIAFLYLLNYFNDLFAERRAEPRDDLVSALLAVEEAGDRLTEEELRSRSCCCCSSPATRPR